MTAWSPAWERDLVVEFAEKRKAALNAFTKEEIRKAASKVIAERGLQGLTMSRVAESAGVAKGTLYNYFPDKGALVGYVIFKSAEPMADRVEEIAASDLAPAEQLLSISRCILNEVETHQELISLAVRTRVLRPPPAALEAEIRQMRRRVLGSVTAVIERGIAQGVFRKGEPAMMAHIFSACVGGLIGPRLMDDVELPLAEEIDLLMSVVLHGIVSPDAEPDRRK